MGIEIERKFLVTGEGWRGCGPGTRYLQGYLAVDAGRSVRVRLSGNAAWLTIKGAARGAVRAEFEYPIPLEDAEEILERCCMRPIIQKIRYRCLYRGTTWEIDEFEGENAGLVVAEVELAEEDEPFELPPWVGGEVTEDPRYLNANLVREPFSRWKHVSRGKD